MNLTEKTAYLKGLADGLEFDKETKEGKLIAALIDLVDELASAVTDLQSDIEEIDSDLDYLNDYIEEIDDDLEAVEDFLDGEDEDGEDCDCCEDCDGDCSDCDCDCDFNCGEDDEFYEIVCPACGEKFGCIVAEDDYQAISEDDAE